MKYKLDDIDKKVTFHVPDGYFEELPLRIQKRMEVESQPLRSIPSWSLALASCVVIVIASLIIFGRSENSAEELLAEISEQDLVAYLDQLDLDEYELVSTFPSEAEQLEFPNIEMLDDVELEGQSIDELMLEYNLEDEYPEI